MIHEVKTITDIYHKYIISFNDFWDKIKDSKIVSKDVYFSTMYKEGSQLTINLEKKEMDNYIKELGLKGNLQSLFLTKDDTVEITTTEVSEVKHD